MFGVIAPVAHCTEHVSICNRLARRPEVFTTVRLVRRPIVRWGKYCMLMHCCHPLFYQAFSAFRRPFYAFGCRVCNLLPLCCIIQYTYECMSAWGFHSPRRLYGHFRDWGASSSSSSMFCVFAFPCDAYGARCGLWMRI